MEARNIGIILCTPDSVTARFVGERLDFNGTVPATEVPGFIPDSGGYVQWIRTWRGLIQRPEIVPIRGGATVTRSSPDFLGRLQEFSNQHYQLVEGGLLLDGDDDLEDSADYLFETIV